MSPPNDGQLAFLVLDNPIIRKAIDKYLAADAEVSLNVALHGQSWHLLTTEPSFTKYREGFSKLILHNAIQFKRQLDHFFSTCVSRNQLNWTDFAVDASCCFDVCPDLRRIIWSSYWPPFRHYKKGVARLEDGHIRFTELPDNHKPTMYAEAISSGILSFASNRDRISYYQLVKVPAHRIFAAINRENLLGHWKPFRKFPRLSEQKIRYRYLFHGLSSEDRRLLTEEITVYNHYLRLEHDVMESKEQHNVNFLCFADIDYGTIKKRKRCNIFVLLFPDDWNEFENSLGEFTIRRLHLGTINLDEHYELIERSYSSRLLYAKSWMPPRPIRPTMLESIRYQIENYNTERCAPEVSLMFFHYANCLLKREHFDTECFEYRLNEFNSEHFSCKYLRNSYDFDIALFTSAIINNRNLRFLDEH
jgi:hypothetical protein